MPVSAASLHNHHRRNGALPIGPGGKSTGGSVAFRSAAAREIEPEKRKAAPAATRHWPSVQERVESLEARSFGPPDRARATLEDQHNGIDRETVRRLMRMVGRGELKAGLSLFRASKASTDLVYRGTRLSDLLRSQPESQDRADWLAMLTGGTRPRRAARSELPKSAEIRCESTRATAEQPASKATPRGASRAAADPVAAAQARRQPHGTVTTGGRGAPPSQVQATPPAPPPKPAGQTERIKVLRALLSNDMKLHIAHGEMAQAWHLWIGLGRPLWVGSVPLLKVLHRLYREFGFNAARNPRDFVGFVAAVEQHQHAVGGLPPLTAPCAKAAAWLDAPAQLQELSMLEHAS